MTAQGLSKRQFIIFGGIGCSAAHDELLALAERIKAPIAYAFRGKQFIEKES